MGVAVGAWLGPALDKGISKLFADIVIQVDPSFVTERNRSVTPRKSQARRRYNPDRKAATR
jgi:hypothetical protein